MTWKKVTFETKQDDDHDLCFICDYDYNPNGSWKAVSHIKESGEYINAYDTEQHLHELYGIHKGVQEYGQNFDSSHNPEAIRLSSDEEAQSFIDSIRNQDWFKAAYHPLLTPLSVTVKPNNRVSPFSAHFHRQWNKENLLYYVDEETGEIDTPKLLEKTLYDPTSSEPITHWKGCKACKGSGFTCGGDDYEMCMKPYPCKRHPRSDKYGCHGILLQGNRIINQLRNGTGTIEYGKASGFSRNKVTFAHELTHAVTPYGTTPATGHGPEFLGSFGFMLHQVLGEEAYEAFRRGTRDQVKSRNLAALNVDAIDPKFVQDIKEDNAAIKGKKRIITPTRQKAIQIDRVKKQKQKKRRDNPFGDLLGF